MRFAVAYFFFYFHSLPPGPAVDGSSGSAAWIVAKAPLPDIRGRRQAMD